MGHPFTNLSLEEFQIYSKVGVTVQIFSVSCNQYYLLLTSYINPRFSFTFFALLGDAVIILLHTWLFVLLALGLDFFQKKSDSQSTWEYIWL